MQHSQGSVINVKIWDENMQQMKKMEKQMKRSRNQISIYVGLTNWEQYSAVEGQFTIAVSGEKVLGGDYFQALLHDFSKWFNLI